MRSVLLLFVASACACGPAVTSEEQPQCDPWESPCVVTMQPDASSMVHLELATAQTEVKDGSGEVGGDEIAVSFSRYLTLGTFGGEGQQCLLGGTYDDLSAIETDGAECECHAAEGCWDGVIYLGLAGTEPDAFVGRGLLLRSADGELYRGRVLHDDPRPEGVELTFEYEGVR